MSKQCQSCGMPLQNKKGDHRGTEKDGSKSEKFCSLCYENGKFRDPDLSLEDMTKVVEEALVKEGWPRPARWMARKQLPRLERWKQ